MAYDQNAYDKLWSQRESLISQKQQAEERDLAKRKQSSAFGGGLTMSGMLGKGNDPYHNVVGGKEAMTLNQQISDLYNQAQAVNPNSAGGKAEAAWQTAMDLLQRQGPYTPEVVNQLTNRRADQTAAAEAVNAEEIRNQAAARGMDPTQAIRQAQQQRQAQNVAFSGDIASQAAVQNFAAETPGRMAAAQANLGRQFGGATAPAVAGGGGGGYQMPSAPTTSRQSVAFSSGVNPVPAPTPPKPVIPQKQPMSVADRNAAQTAWANSGGRTINGTAGRPAMAPAAAVSPTAAANTTPVTGSGQVAFGPVSTAQNARSYQNIFKYTN